MAPPVSSSDRHQNVTRDFHKQRNKYSLPPRFSSAEQQNLLIVIKMSNSNFQLSNVFDVKGKVALVTGGGSGIGLMVIRITMFSTSVHCTNVSRPPKLSLPTDPRSTSLAAPKRSSRLSSRPTARTSPAKSSLSLATLPRRARLRSSLRKSSQRKASLIYSSTVYIPLPTCTDHC